MNSLEDRIDAVERTLDARGCVVLSPQLWPGASEDAVERALQNFYAVVEALDLEVERLGDGTRIAFRADTPDSQREALRNAAAAGSN